MKRLLTIFRNFLHVIAFTVVLGVVALYMAIHFNLVGMGVERMLTETLSDEISTRVTIDGDAEVSWLNQVVLNHLTIYDQQDDTLLYARRVLVAYDILPLLQHHLILNTCQLIDFDIRATKDSTQGDYNFQFIIDELSKDNTDHQQFIEAFDLNAILLRKGKLSLDVKDQPVGQSAVIDQHHLHISEFNANLHFHGNQLQAKKIHFLLGETSVKASQFVTSFAPRDTLRDNREFPFSLHGFTIDDRRLTLQADAEGTGRAIDLHLKSLKTRGQLPSLAYLQDVGIQADLHVDDVLVPLDSMTFLADIRQAEAIVEKLGTTRLNAQISGMPRQMDIKCQLFTDKGEARFEGISVNDFQQGMHQVHGHCISDVLNLSELLPASAEVGTVAINVDVDLLQQANQPLWMALDGTIGRLDFRQHTFHDILVEGNGQGGQFQGRMSVADSLGSIDMAFDVDLDSPLKRYKLDGSFSHLQPKALHLVESSLLDSIAISGRLYTDIIAPHWNEAEGVINLTHGMLQRGKERVRLEPIMFEGRTDRGILTSQMLQIDYQRNRRDGSYRIEGKLPVANELYKILGLPVQASSLTRFEMVLNENKQIHEAWLDMPTLQINGNQEVAAVAVVRRRTSGQFVPTIDLTVRNSEHKIQGTLRGEINLNPLEVTLSPSTLIYNNEELKLAGAHMIRTKEGDYAFQDFSLEGVGQSISASGVISNNGNNDLIIQLENFELGQIFSNFNKNYVKIHGQATGDIVLSSEPQTHLRTEDLQIQNFSYIDTLLGNASLSLDFLVPQKLIALSCEIDSDSRYTSYIDGTIQLGTNDSLDLYFNTNHLPIGFINNWTGSILQDFCGTATGPIRLFGDTHELQLVGDALVDGRFTHDVIGAHFHLCDSVHLEENLISLRNASVDDCHGHPMLLNADITHQHLSNFGYDVNLEMPEANQGFLVLDREQAPGRIYWGQLYVSGQASLKGGDGHHRFNINLATTDRSWFYLSPFEKDYASEQVGDYTFLTFRDKALLQDLDDTGILTALSTGSISEQTSEAAQESKTDLQVDMQINATDQCQVTVQLDPLAEDKLICRGQGDLALHYDPRRDITLAGIYHINSGSYGMSVKGDLMNKVFQLKNTSTVRFSGVPSEAELALDASYSIPSVNLTDLDESITSLGSLSRATVPVDCLLAVTGQLSAPQVSFDLDVKNVSDDIQAYVHNVIGTQEMLNQEVLYLLLFSKFYTPQYAQSTQSRSGSELTSFASASITSQLNQLLGHVSNNFTMGTNFRSDRGDFSDMEMDVSLSTRLLGDRLLLNGNVGYRDPANRLGAANGNSNTFIGDFDIEYLINNSGSLRAKAYSHYNERDYSINNALTTQGIGFLLRKDFQSFHDLWRRKK